VLFKKLCVILALHYLFRLFNGIIAKEELKQFNLRCVRNILIDCYITVL
jgi:hypothetical protein